MSCLFPTQPCLPKRWVSFLCTVQPSCEIDQPLAVGSESGAGRGAAKEWGGVHEQPSPCGGQVLVSSGQRPVLLTPGNFREAQGYEGALLRKT